MDNDPRKAGRDDYNGPHKLKEGTWVVDVRWFHMPTMQADGTTRFKQEFKVTRWSKNVSFSGTL